MKFLTLISAGLLCVSLSSSAIAADVQAGAKVGQTCVMCHGENGLATMAGTPSLAGQSEIYLVNQLKHFRDGSRVNEVMSIIAKPLSDTDIDNVSAWFSQFQVELKKR